MRAAARDFVCVQYEIGGKSSVPLPRKFPTMQVPVLFFLDPDQNDLGRQDGPHDAEETVAAMQQALAAWQAGRERVDWVPTYAEGLERAQNLVRPFVVVLHYPREGGKALEQPVWQDAEVGRASKRMVWVSLDCEADAKRATVFKHATGVKVLFLNPFDRGIPIALEGVPDKAKLLESMAELQKKFDEWYEQWKANRRK